MQEQDTRAGRGARQRQTRAGDHDMTLSKGPPCHADAMGPMGVTADPHVE